MAHNLKLDGMSLQELQALHDEVGGVLAQKKAARRQELLEELDSLGGLPANTRSRATAGDGEGRTRAKPKPMYRAPDGREWSGRGAIPRFFKELGVTDKADLEKYKIAAEG
ncbi:MAG: hypothetical protein CMP81_23020 [Fulvimarina sp.]|nr:hypothetical protein [Fulvimarina sp.]